MSSSSVFKWYVCIVYSMTDDVGGNKGERERGGGEVEDEEKKRS